MTNSMLSIRPDYEIVTRFGAAWLTQILNAANSAGLNYVDLYKEQATAENFFYSLNTLDPLIVNILGHGLYNLITCQYGETLFQGGVNTDLLAGRVVFDLSCEAGRDLADHAINEGCISFLGYSESFWVVIEGVIGGHPDGGMDNPLEDKYAQAFFESHNAAPITYINEGDLGNCYQNSQNTFNEWIRFWNASSDMSAPFIIEKLIYDRDAQVLKPFVEKPKFPLLLFLPLLIIPLISLNKTKHLYG